MGSPVEFVGANAVLGAPKGNEHDVQPMHVFRNGWFCVSCWQLSDEEVAEIVRTRRVFVSVMSGDTQPPIYAGGEDATRALIVDYGGASCQPTLIDDLREVAMGMPDVDEVEILGAETAILQHFRNVIGNGQARNIAYVALAGARGAKFNSERAKAASEQTPAKPCDHNWQIWPETDGQEERCVKCGAYRAAAR